MIERKYSIFKMLLKSLSVLCSTDNQNGLKIFIKLKKLNENSAHLQKNGYICTRLIISYLETWMITQQKYPNPI